MRMDWNYELASEQATDTMTINNDVGIAGHVGNR